MQVHEEGVVRVDQGLPFGLGVDHLVRIRVSRVRVLGLGLGLGLG